MEEFFKQPILEKLYNLLSDDFEEKLVNDKKYCKNYNEILDKKEILYNNLKLIIDDGEKNLENFNIIVKELQNLSCKEIEYWSKNYFKLGFIYKTELEKEMDYYYIQKDFYALKIHKFLDNVKENGLSEKEKIQLMFFINDLDEGTEKQKERFLMFYNLVPNSKGNLSYSDIGKIEKCSSNAIKSSIATMISILINLDGVQKTFLLCIIEKINKERDNWNKL